jgi:twitching motility protein PilT
MPGNWYTYLQQLHAKRGAMAEHALNLGAIVDEAVRLSAADILLSFNTVPALKLDGKLHRLDYPPLSDQVLEALVKEIVTGDKVAILEEKRQVDLAYASGPARFRVNVFYQRGHLSVVMRYVRNQIRTLDELGMPEIMKEILGNDNGLILMVGPTGSGKSTSLAAMVEHLNANFDRHIITIEDPIEYMYENKQSIIEQREVGVDTMDFPSALRSVLREAPDAVLLGEMRDLESISSAITVAETGHLVLSTIHANSAVSTIDRIIDIFPAGFKDQIRIQLADVLLAVFNQRLVPRADGKGSMAIVEVMIANAPVRNAIRTANGAQLPNILQTSSGDGMHLLDDLLVKAVRHGDITKEAALEYASDRGEVRKGLSLV